MHPVRKKRLQLIVIMVLLLGLAAGFILYALKQNINVYFTPSELAETVLVDNKVIRLGGMVADNSIQHGDNLQVEFIVTDFKQQYPVRYEGVLPNLFREGKGVIVQGRMTNQGYFAASQVLAKHDENYMPPKVAAEKMRQLS